MKNDTISCFIVDDHELVSKSVGELLEKESLGTIRFVGHATTEAMLWEKLQNSSPAVLLLDISLIEGDGLLLLVEVKKKFPRLKVIMLTTHNNQQYLNYCLNQGASGYFLKTSPSENLIDAIKKVIHGGIYIDEELEQIVSSNSITITEQTLLTRYPITKREAEVWLQIVKGRTNKQIGEQLFIAESTVETHRKSLKAKLKIRTTAELTLLLFD